MNELIKRIASKVSVDYLRLSIVSNPDGLLTQEAVRTLLYQQHEIEVITGTNLQLRIHFELKYKQDTCHYLYVTNNIDTILPDMRREAFICNFSASDAFPLFADKSLLCSQPFEVLSELYDQVAKRRVTMAEGNALVIKIKEMLELKAKQSAEFCMSILAALQPDWSKPLQDITTISKVVVNAIRNGVYHQILPAIDSLNQSFQDWIDNDYFATLNSNHLLHPKSVNKILPHLAEKYAKDEKMALLVVDGLTYWQYVVLKNHLEEGGIITKDGTTLSWLPSITMLSRQAIFRGDVPDANYKQNPENEKKLWQSFWKKEGFGSYEVQYISDKDEFAINPGVKRLAVVTVEMDEKMHSSSDNKDLLSLTENWCVRITEKIKAILQAGFALYLTTDHGSTLSFGRRPLTQVESVFLYKDGSRGKRHLIYNNTDEQNRFYNEFQWPLLKHDNWLAIRDNGCFAREGETMITHGGSHFMEVVVPFVQLNLKK